MKALPQSTERDLWVSWSDYHDLIEQLVLLVDQAGIQFDHILCLARGGLRVGDVLSRVLDLPLSILAASSYRSAAGTEQGKLSLAPFITGAQGPLSGNVLVVDDLVDSGVTLAEVVAELSRAYPAVTKVCTAVLWYKAVSSFKPDFFVHFLPTNPWIHQPFEVYDHQRPQDLALSRAKGLS